MISWEAMTAVMDAVAGQAAGVEQPPLRTWASVAPAVTIHRHSRWTGRWTAKGRENLQGGQQGRSVAGGGREATATADQRPSS